MRADVPRFGGLRSAASACANACGDEARIRPGDSVIAFNFRPDRMRQITRALAEPGFGEFGRGAADPVERYTTMKSVDAYAPLVKAEVGSVETPDKKTVVVNMA